MYLWLEYIQYLLPFPIFVLLMLEHLTLILTTVSQPVLHIGRGVRVPADGSLHSDTLSACDGSASDCCHQLDFRYSSTKPL